MWQQKKKSIANTSARSEAWGSPPRLNTGIFNWLDFVQVLWRWPRLPWVHVQRTACHGTAPILRCLRSMHLSPSTNSLNTGRGWGVGEALIKISQLWLGTTSHVFPILWPVLSLCITHNPLQLRSLSGQGYTDWHPFSKIASRTFPLRVMTSAAMGFKYICETRHGFPFVDQPSDPIMKTVSYPINNFATIIHVGTSCLVDWFCSTECPVLVETFDIFLLHRPARHMLALRKLAVG